MKQKLVISLSLSAAVLGAVVWLLLSGDSGSTRVTGRSRDPGAGDAEVSREGALKTDPGSGDVSSVAAGGRDVSGAVEAASSPASEDGAVLHGRVIEVSGESVDGARVLVRTVSGLPSWGDADRFEYFRSLALGRLKNDPPRIVAEQLTGPDGAYSFEIASLPRGRFQVLVVKDGLAPESESWAWTPESTRLDFRLGLGATISGLVLGPDGNPVEDARVEASRDEERRGFGGFGRFGQPRDLVGETRTDGDGRFRLNVGSSTYVVSARASGYSPDEARRVPAGNDEVLLRLGPGRNLEGTVRDEAGRPLGGAEVSLFRSRFGGDDDGRRRGRFRGRRGTTPMQRRLFSSAVGRTLSGPGGEFRFENLDEGGYYVLVEKPAFRPSEERVELGEEMRTSEVEVVMPRGRVLSGRVIGPGGQPVASALVVVGRDRSDDDGGRRGRGRGRGRGDRGDRRSEERERLAERLRQEGRLEELANLEEAERRREERRAREPVSLFRSSQAVETDADGRFRVDTLGDAVYTLSVQADDFVPFREPEIDLEASDREGVVITLDAGTQLQGRVVSSVGTRPVPNASLVFTRSERGGFRTTETRSVRTDEEGRYRLGGLAPGDRWSLTADAPGYSAAFVDDVGVPSSSEARPLDIILDPSGRVSGRVVDSSGAPVQRARVRIEEMRPPQESRRGGRERWRAELRRRAGSSGETTDVDGRFAIEDVSPGRSLELRVTHPEFKEYRGEQLSVAPGQSIDGLTVVLDSGGRLVVHVRDPDGMAVTGARVQLRKQTVEASAAPGGPAGDDGDDEEDGRERRRRSFRDFWRNTTWRTSDAEGRAVFSGMDEGRYEISLSQRGFQPFVGSVDLVEGRSADYGLNLLRENVITGIVIDTMGTPVDGARVQARSRGGRRDPFSRGGESRTATRADGTFRVGSLGAGPYDLRVERRGFATGRLEDVPVLTDQRIVLERLGSVSGWVVASESGAPVTSFEIRARVRTTSDGDEEGGATPDGEGDRGGRRGGFRGGGFGRGGFFRGGDSRGRRQRFDDPQGAFTVDNLPKGDYTLEVTARGFTGARADVSVGEGEAVEGVVVRLLEGLSVAGVVVDGTSSQPVEGARVYIMAQSASEDEDGGDDGGPGSIEDRRGRRRERRSRPDRESRDRADEDAAAAVALMRSIGADAGSGAPLVTDGEGYFRLPEVRPGLYTLLVYHDAYVPWTETVEVDERRGPMERLVGLDRGSEIRGKATLAGRLPAAGITLLFEQNGGIRKRVTADESGRYSSTGFIPGTYSVRAIPVQGEVAGAPVLSVTVKKGKNDFDYDIAGEK